MEFLGFKLFGRKEAEVQKKEDDKRRSFVLPADAIDGGYTNDAGVAGGHFGQFLDIAGTNFRNESELIMKYRNIALIPEVDAAIEDVVAESIVSDEDSAPVELVTDDLDVPDRIKKIIKEEFDTIIELLNFNWYGHDIFRRWYVDGRLYYHNIIDQDNPKNGLIEIRPIDPTKLNRVKQPVKMIDPKTGLEVITRIDEYYVYQATKGANGAYSTGLKIPKEAITFVSSGLLDPTRSNVIGYLHKALKTANQLNQLEDSLVIYRLARAPERRIFYIDVGNLPKGKAEEYVNGIMSRYRNKMVYDANTGAVKDDKKTMSMLEDFWLPRREGGRGTEITTLPGGDNLGQIDDVQYFTKKLYKSLGVPSARINPDEQGMASLGRSNEITRDELKYQKFISRLRKKFSMLFIDLLKTQLLVKGIMNLDDWNLIAQKISITFLKDNHFYELADLEIMRDKLETLQLVDPFVGKYYSVEWVRRKILNQNDEDYDEINKQLTAEPLPQVQTEGFEKYADQIRSEIKKEESYKGLMENINEFMKEDTDPDEHINNIISLLESRK